MICKFSCAEPLKVMSFEAFRKLCSARYYDKNNATSDNQFAVGCVRCECGKAIVKGLLKDLPDNVGLIEISQTKEGKMAYGKCGGCGRVLTIRAKGLCNCCWKKDSLGVKTPLEEKAAKRNLTLQEVAIEGSPEVDSIDPPVDVMQHDSSAAGTAGDFANQDWKIQDLEAELCDRNSAIGAAIEELSGDDTDDSYLSCSQDYNNLNTLVRRRMAELLGLRDLVRQGPLALSGYQPLFSVLAQALNQAQHGKGHDRHANGLPFLQQPIMIETRSVGLGFPAGQARKKILEAINCCDSHPDRAIADLLGAINYTAAVIIGITERQSADQEQAA